MSTSYESSDASSLEAVKQYYPTELRSEFLISNLMEKGKINLTYSHYDWYISGGAAPDDPLNLDTINSLKTEYFLERRELALSTQFEINNSILTMDKVNN